jgi:hypothetical protein
MRDFLSSRLNDCNRIREVEGATLLSPTATTAHHTLIYRGRWKSQNMRTKLSKDMFMPEDVAIAIDRTTLQSVYTCTQSGMELHGDQPTEPILPCELPVVTVPSCIRPSKRSPSQRELHRNCEMPRVATRETHWEKVVSLPPPPTDTLYPAGRYGSALAELNSALTPLSVRWCVWKGQVKSLSTRFQTEASSCPPSVSKTPTPVLRKPYKWGYTEECTPIPDPRSVVSSSPPSKYPKHLLLPVLPHSRQESLLPKWLPTWLVKGGEVVGGAPISFPEVR